jgi:hypothetical protein
MLSHHPLKNYKETLGCSPSTPLENLAGSTPESTDNLRKFEKFTIWWISRTFICG